ncbi:hypothetical protein PMI21_00438, partial [Pseudomonas sp. GM18]
RNGTSHFFQTTSPANREGNWVLNALAEC